MNQNLIENLVKKLSNFLTSNWILDCGSYKAWFSLCHSCSERTASKCEASSWFSYFLKFSMKSEPRRVQENTIEFLELVLMLSASKSWKMILWPGMNRSIIAWQKMEDSTNRETIRSMKESLNSWKKVQILKRDSFGSESMILLKKTG